MTLKGHIHVSRIAPHPDNPRADLGDLTELAASIRVQGILQPLLVQPFPGRPGHYQLLAGHRRLAAARRLRMDTVPATVRPAREGSQRARALEVMLVENCQRRDLGPVEKAEAMGQLRDLGMNAVAIARRIGLSPSTVSYYLSLLDLDAATRARIAAGTVRVSDARAAVTRTRKATRGGSTGRPAHAEPAWLTGGHRLARIARALCDQLAHTTRPMVGNVACGQCWEQAIRDDAADTDEPEPEPERQTARQERLQVVASLRMHHGSDAKPPGHVTAAQAAEQLGVTKRTIERYKRDLAEVSA